MGRRLTPAAVFPPGFAKFVEVDPDDPTGCWLWRGARQTKGYGAYHLWIGDRHLSLAHHAAMLYATGMLLLPGWIYMHRCNRRICVKPTDLLAGTVADNNRQCRLEGRWRGRASGLLVAA